MLKFIIEVQFVMEQFNHESNLINVSSATAVDNRKKRSRYRLFIAMAAACFVAPAGFLIYFAITANYVGIWAFAITLFLAACAASAVLYVVIPRLKSANDVIKNFLESGGELKKTPALDTFCITTVKILFTVMASFLVCAVPTLVTVCQGMTFLETLNYMGECLGAFWGMSTSAGDFFSYIVGIGLMAVIFGLLLLIVKFINKLLK